MTASAFGQQLSVVNQGGAITINDNSAASPFPSTNRVQGVVGVLERVAVILNNVSHGYPDDMDIILEGPDGTRTTLVSDAGGQFDLFGTTFTLDSVAGSVIEDEAAITTGAFRPFNYSGGDLDTFPAPASGATPATSFTAGNYSGLGADLGVFVGKSGNAINGTWNLFVADDTVVDSGSIGSWALTLYVTPILSVNNSAPIAMTEDTPATINLMVTDADTPLSSLILKATSSDPSIIPNTSSAFVFGGNTGGTNRTLTITPAANAIGGPVTITITAQDAEGHVYLGINHQTIVVNVAGVNDAPSMVLPTASTTIPQGGISTNIAIHLRDTDTPASLVTLTATSSNPSVIPATNVLFRTLPAANAGQDEGTNRVVQIAAGQATGSSRITIIATDSAGASSSTTIDVAVAAVPRVVIANQTLIAAPESGAASSTITVPNAANLGRIGKAVVSLINVEHPAPSELGVLLVSPSGEKIVLMRGAGNGNPVGTQTNDVRLTFDVDATTVLGGGPIVTSTNDPVDLGSGNFPSPAPVGPYTTDLAALTGTASIGNWTLYVYDSTANSSTANGATPRIAGGWVLELYPGPAIGTIATQNTPEDTAINVGFSVGDFDGIVTNVVAVSSDSAIVPSPAAIGNTNGLSSGTFTFTPVANANGPVTVSVIAKDNSGYSNTNTFTLNVVPVNDAPTQTVIQKQLARAGQSVGPISFTVGDIETPAANLTVTATSNNPKLLPPGAIVVAGSGAVRTVTIFPAGSQAGQADITVTVTDNGSGSPNSTPASSTQTFDLTVNEAANPLFENANGIQIVDAGAASPYPSTITVSGLQGALAEVQVALFGITHPSPDDLDILLVGPGSSPAGILLMSDAGGGTANALNNVTLRFRLSTSSAPSAPVPDEGLILSGDYVPSNFAPNPDFPLVGQTSPLETIASLDQFSGINPNGDWRLYVIDDAAGPVSSVKSLISSWQLSLRTRPVLPATLPDVVTAEDTAARFSVPIGDNQPGVPFTVTYSKATVGTSPDVIASIVTSGGVTIPPGGTTIGGGTQSLTINPVADAAGTNTITLTIADPNGFSVTRTFAFIVTAVNDAPRFGTVNNRSTPAATPEVFSFNVTDPEGTAVTVVGTSSRQDIVPDSGIVITPATGIAASRNVVINPAGTASGETTITLTATDADGQKSTKTFTLTVTPNVSFVNPAPIAINDNAAASPYPSTIDVSGVNGTVSGATVVLVGLSHPFPDDVDVLLVAPDGRSVMLMSDSGGGNPVSNLRVTFADNAAGAIPDETALSSTSYRPANNVQPGELNEMPSPAPAAPGTGYSTLLSSLAGVNPNGQWRLFVRDDTFPDGGTISGGWILLLQTAPSITQIGTQTTAEDTALPIRFTVSDQDTAATGLSISASIQSSGTVNNQGFNDPGLFPVLSGPPFNSPFFNLVTNSSNFPEVSYTLTVLPSTNRPYANGATETNSVTINVTDGSTTASTTFLVRVTAVDDAPQITGAFVPGASFSYATNNVITTEDTPIVLQYQVLDVDSTLGVSTNVVVQSSNPALIPNATANIGLPTTPNNVGTSNAFTVSVTLTPASNQNSNTVGDTVLSFIVADRTQTSTNQVTVSVRPVNDLPTINIPSLTSSSPSVSVGVGNSITVPFTVGDVETAAQDISVTATTPNDAGTQSIIPNSNLVLGGRGSDRNLTITAIGTVTVATTINVTITANDGTGGTVTATLPVVVTPPPGQIVRSLGSINIPGTGTAGQASPYGVGASQITVAGLIGNISRVSVSVDGLTHTAPDDIDMLLVSPGGQKIILMSDAGNRNAVSNVQLTFDTAGRALPDEGLITTGSYQPADFEPGLDTFPAPAPGGPYSTSLSTVVGTPANGTWSLYIVDDATGDSGQIVTGWSLRIETGPSIQLNSGLNQPAGTPTFVQFAEDTTYDIEFTVNDPVTPPNNLSISFASSNSGIVQAVNTSVVSNGPQPNERRIRATIVPAVNAFGTNNLSIVVRRSDGAQSSLVVPMNITALNDAPLISRLIDRTTEADSSIVGSPGTELEFAL